MVVQALEALGSAPKRVFLAIGRQEAPPSRPRPSMPI